MSVVLSGSFYLLHMATSCDQKSFFVTSNANALSSIPGVHPSSLRQIATFASEEEDRSAPIAVDVRNSIRSESVCAIGPLKGDGSRETRAILRELGTVLDPTAPTTEQGARELYARFAKEIDMDFDDMAATVAALRTLALNGFGDGVPVPDFHIDRITCTNKADLDSVLTRATFASSPWSSRVCPVLQARVLQPASSESTTDWQVELLIARPFDSAPTPHSMIETVTNLVSNSNISCLLLSALCPRWEWSQSVFQT